MTTNHIEKLDPALLRPGRVNLKVNLNYMTPEMFTVGFERFFPDFAIPEQPKWNRELSPAHFQSLIFKHLDCADEVFKSATQEVSLSSDHTEQTSAPSNVISIELLRQRESNNL